WVAKAWLCDIGLPQYSQNFLKHLVDGRVLRSLTRRDLEKHLSITKKFHQVSILLGIELLRPDPSCLIRWSHLLRNELSKSKIMNVANHFYVLLLYKEYADNLEFSGVHGAVLVLEPAFNAEALASALHIPSHRHILRRHLSEELKVPIKCLELKRSANHLQAAPKCNKFDRSKDSGVSYQSHSFMAPIRNASSARSFVTSN
uniref:SAM domain-containing protein n=1 Tax=Erpetoichthys calabaricus TaxID=27687 RepID=A0A8C4SGR6_ERPCA